MDDVVIASAVRTPIGRFLGALKPLAAPALGAAAVRAAVERAGLRVEDDPNPVEQVIFGNVLQAGIGQAPARQATLGAGLPKSVGAITVHKVCGSSMRAIMDAGNGIRAGEWSVVVAGGMESMSNAPHLLERSRDGFRMGHVEVTDSMIKDGLWDPYGDVHMGSCAELCAREYDFTRAAQDTYALESYRRARQAAQDGSFDAELIAVEVPQRKGAPVRVSADEEPSAAPLEKIRTLAPAFATPGATEGATEGTVTAGNASKINDGAAALVVASAARAAALGMKPLARIVAYASVAQDPQWFTTAPVGAARKALARADLRADAIDLWEINEAFAVVAMAAIRDLELDPATVNVHGGAVALGHPIGASGARIVTTLVHALARRGARYGCASICIGGGEATAVIVENLVR